MNVLTDDREVIDNQTNAKWSSRMILLDQNHRIIWAQPRGGVYISGASYG